jgi:cytoskeleton protein RodZ
MAKREIEGEPVDETPVEENVPTAGQRLRAAREEKGVSLEDVAAQTRIPQRHLESIEAAEWDSLPAATYTIGFAKSYASAVGLDRTEIGDQLREEMGGQRFANSHAEVIEAADPARTMPKWLVIGAVAGVILLVLLMTWVNSRSLEQPDASNNVAAAPEAAAPAATTAPAPSPAAGQTVVLTATQPVWFQVSEKGGASLFSGMLQPGQTYAVPPTATAPVLKTGKPEALRISVGNQVAPPVGPPAKTVSNVSLLAADLMKPPAPATATPASIPTPAPKPQARRPATPAPVAPPPVAAPSPATTTAPATSNTGE